MVNIMNLLQSIFGHLKLDDDFELDVRFGLSMQCICAIMISIGYGIFYLSIGLYELFFVMTFVLACSSAMLIYGRLDGQRARSLTCLGISVQYALIHLFVTYYSGSCGTVFFVVSAMLIPHLYPLLKLRHTLILDIFLLITLNFTFWYNRNYMPIYNDKVGESYRFVLNNIGLIICLLALYVNRYSMNTLKTVRQRLVDSASNTACLDALTGLGNRRMLSRYQTALETETDAPMCLAVIDIDCFKSINDTYGHAIGDKALVFVADTMKGYFRKSDLLIRWGGEEFLVFFRFTKAENAWILMERFRLMLQDSPFIVDGINLNISVTIGLTEHCIGASLNESIARADAMMYRGKSNGRNCVVTEKLCHREL